MFTTWLFSALDAVMPLEMDGEVVNLITTGEFMGKPSRILHVTIEQGEFNLPVQEQIEFLDQLIEISPDGNTEVIQVFRTQVNTETRTQKTLCFPLEVFSLVDEFNTNGF